MTEANPRLDQVSRNVGAAGEAVLNARGDHRKLVRIFEYSNVPMVMLDDSLGYIEVNRPARLWFRRALQEMRTFVLGDLAPANMQQAWERLLDVGCVAGRHPVSGGSDGSRLDVVYCALARILPELHLIAFAPADWPEDRLDPIEEDRHDAFPPLTPREIQVLTLAADGLSGPRLAKELVLSPATVRTHFENIYAKLDVRNRAAAVAMAMRLGLIR
jgi:DNA-binding NarL/FixJ family response regulator